MKPGARWKKRLHRVKGRIAYRLDCAVAPRINPCRTLVVSGFWRSGTTWLQQSMAAILPAKTIFEPLHVLVPAARRIHSDLNLSGRSAHVRELCMPYCREPTLPRGPLFDAFAASLRGEVRGGAVRAVRTSLTESLRSRVVVKCVRAHLCLWAAQNTFSMPVIHLYRDPRAVLASIRMTGWAWLFDHLSLREQLLEIEDGRADYFGEWRDEILEFDGRDVVARVSAYWALTEKYLARCYEGEERSTSTGPVWFLSFERVCAQPGVVLAPICDTLGATPSWSDEGGALRALRKDSQTTSRSRMGTSPEDRLTGWRTALSPAEIATIESVAVRFGFENRLAAPSAR
jgi:hypothetical protein